jgi:hypothetical protein
MYSKEGIRTMRLLLTTLVLLLGAWVGVSTGQSSCADETPLGMGTTYRIPAGASLSTIPSNLKPGDNVLFERGGTYNPTAQINITADGTASQKILFGTYGTGARPVINGTKIPTNHFYGLNFDGANHIIVDGLELRNMVNGQAITIHNNSNNITIRRSKINVARVACVKIAGGSDDAVVEYNEILGCGTGGSYGESIYVGTDPLNTTTEDVVLRPTIRYNTIIDTDKERIEFKGGVRNGIIEGNVIQGGNQGILVSHWSTSTFQNAHKIRYNLIRDIVGSGGSIYGMAIRSGAEIHHNVVANVGGTSRPGIWIHDIANQNQVITAHHNTVYNASGAGTQDGGGANTTFSSNLVRASGSGNFAQDPLFVSPASFDFRIPSGSPASGAGAYAVGQALRPVGHTACLGTDPEEPQPLPTPTGLRLARE